MAQAIIYPDKKIELSDKKDIENSKAGFIEPIHTAYDEQGTVLYIGLKDPDEMSDEEWENAKIQHKKEMSELREFFSNRLK